VQVLGDVVGERSQYCDDHVAAVFVSGDEGLDHSIGDRVLEFGAGDLQRSGDVECRRVPLVSLPRRPKRRRT
jgi:hypothetical protein